MSVVSVPPICNFNPVMLTSPADTLFVVYPCCESLLTTPESAKLVFPFVVYLSITDVAYAIFAASSICALSVLIFASVARPNMLLSPR